MMEVGGVMSPESRIVFLTAGGAANEKRAVDLLATKDLDWGRVLQLAHYERAGAALSRVVERAGQGVVPADVALQLRRQRMVSDFHMQHLRDRLRQTLRSLRQREIDVMLLKGAALGETIYPSFVDRPMSDIDLLIHPADADRSTAALHESGWKRDADPLLEPFYKEHHHLPPFSDGQGSGHKLELHVAPFPPPNPFGEANHELWAEAEARNGVLCGARIPRREHLLLYCCIHFAWSHTMQKGAWRTFRDVTALTEAGVDWDLVRAMAARWKASSATFWTMSLAATMAGSPVPRAVVESLRPPLPRSVIDPLHRHFVTEIVPGEGIPCPSLRLTRTLWRIAIRPRWSGHGGNAALPDLDRWRSVLPPPAEKPGSPGVIARLRRLGDWASFVTG